MRDFTPILKDKAEMIDIILNRISNGDSLKTICIAQDFPKPHIFYKWCREDHKLNNDYKNAKIYGIHSRIDACHDIARDKNINPFDKKLMIDHAHWEAARLLSHIYGDTKTQDTVDNKLENLSDKQLDLQSQQLDQQIARLNKSNIKELSYKSEQITENSDNDNDNDSDND